MIQNGPFYEMTPSRGHLVFLGLYSAVDAT